MTYLTKYIFNFHFKHLKSNNETYTQHIKNSWYYGIVCFKLAIYFFVHGIYPDIFENTSVELSQLLTIIKMNHNNKKQNSLSFYFNPSKENLI